LPACLCREVICSFHFITYAVDISLVTEPLPSYQQFLIVGFRGYESCTRCLATARLEHTYLLRYFGPFGQNVTFLPAYTLPYTYSIRKKREMKLYHSRKDSYAGAYTHTHTHTYIHFYTDRIRFVHISIYVCGEGRTGGGRGNFILMKLFLIVCAY
jgi:hypothetical protein